MDAHQKMVVNERRKLAATLFNNVAVAFIVTGFVVLIVNLAYQSAAPKGSYWGAYLLLWLVTAAANHQIARYHLSRMVP